MKKDSIKIKVLVLSILIIVSACKEQSSIEQNENNKATEKTELIIFHAGSLSVPFKEVSEKFEKENPNIKVILESAGSRQCARKITDLNRECDIMASADYTVIDKLLIPDFADWNIKFATNEMAIVYTKDSRYNNEINKDNWFNILLKNDVAYGRSEPDSDPCGYRTVLTTKLAENYYKQKGLTSILLEKDKNYIRPKEVDLLGLLESNAIDYIFLYRSVAEQHGLKYIILPDEINLKNPDYSELYSTVNVEVSGKKPGEYIVKKGEAMVYGITIIKNAPNKNAAQKFVDYLLDKEKGMKIIESNGQPSIIPTYSETYNMIPAELKKYSKNE